MLRNKNILVLLFFSLLITLLLGFSNSAEAQCTDNDGDGFNAEVWCAPVDCNDNDPAVYPGAPEICDGKDNNCDYWMPPNEVDNDGDGVFLCGGDCNDNDPSAFPGNAEFCGDGIDNNCNWFTDEAGCICPDADGDGATAAYCGGTDCDDSDPAVQTNCAGCTDADGDGIAVEGGSCGPVDCDDTDPNVKPGAAEICDGKDSNCDGWKPPSDTDADGDGYAVCGGDCNDNDANTFPGGTEICGDGIDNNCNYFVDEAGCICPDNDGDGRTALYCGGTDCDDNDPTIFENCPGCTDSDGDNVFAEGGNCGPVDCDDTDPNVRPGAAEICDGKDSDCDGWKPPTDVDADGDGVALCANDCDDNDPARFPGNFEHVLRNTCADFIDNDCDTAVDAADADCIGNCTTASNPKDGPHFFTLLNPDDTVHPDSGTLNCGKCHGADFADPIRYTCQRCHENTADPSDPQNGTIKAQYPLNPPYGYGSAPDVSMHVTWTLGDQGCVVCHNPHAQEQDNQWGTMYGKYVKEYICYDPKGIEDFVEFTTNTGAGSFADGPPYTANICNTCHTLTNHHQNDGTAPGGQDHNNGQDCMQCHGHDGGFAPTGGTPAPPHDTEEFTNNCDYCHVSSSDFSTPIPDSKCGQCHTPVGSLKAGFPTAPDVVTHQGRTCVGCHEPMFGTGNIAHVRTDLTAVGGGVNIDFTSRTGAGSFADGPPHTENVCETCHTATNHHQNDGTAPGGQSHFDGADCASCHLHSADFSPAGGGCLQCHNQSPPAGSSDPDRRQIVEGTPGDGNGDFVRTSHHVTDGTGDEIVTEDDCLVCHDQTQHGSFGDGQSVLLNDQDGGASYTYDGSGISVEGFCVSCHDGDGSLTNGPQPFSAAGDINSPADIGWAAGVVSHSTFDACFNCHDQGHGSDFDKLLSEANEPGLCFGCHNAAGPASTDIESEFAKTFGHPVTAAGSSIQCLDCHNPHQAEPGTHTPDGQWYPSSPDANTNLVSGVLSGVMGVEPSPWAPAWTKTDSYTVLDSAEKEYQVCFKCHARYAHQYSQDCFLCHPTTWDPDLGIIVIGYQFRSAQREFNINNKSAHPVVVTSNNQSGSYAPKALSTSQLEAPWTNAGNQTMYCSDCHGADDELITGIRGPHGSDQEFTLKGTNTMWPAGSVRLFSLNDISSDNGAPESLNTNWRNELFCLNCHDSFPSSNKDTWKNEVHKEHDDRDYSPLGGGSGDGDSNVYCIACHAVVPHGSHVSRLITYRSELPEYNTYNGDNYNVIEGFRKTSRWTYDKDDCRTVTNLGCDKHDDRVNNWD